jgi:hypothetical protein
MSSDIFKQEWIKRSAYPVGFIPQGASLFTGTDKGLAGVGYIVRGFYKEGEYHIQSVDWLGG